MSATEAKFNEAMYECLRDAYIAFDNDGEKIAAFEDATDAIIDIFRKRYLETNNDMYIDRCCEILAEIVDSM